MEIKAIKRNQAEKEYINQIKNAVFDEERALYNIKDTEVINCTFAGPADGESVLKEGRNYEVKNSSFSLRYPMWHARNFSLVSSSMDDMPRPTSNMSMSL